MIYTNTRGVPDTILKALEQDRARYAESRGSADITVTQLIKPPRMVMLEKENQDKLVIDVSERIWALFGSAFHSLMEKAEGEGLQEIRAKMCLAGWEVSGKLDYLQSSGTLIDYKVTKAYAVHDGVRPEWIQQLNGLALLLRHQRSIRPKQLQVTVFFRDWDEWDMKKSPEWYPPNIICDIPIPIWKDEEQVAWMTERVMAHQAARRGKLPECSPEERWHRPETYAVMKQGNTRATSIMENIEDAQAIIAQMDKPHLFRIDVRPGSDPRCERYCDAREFCDQWKAIKVARGIA